MSRRVTWSVVQPEGEVLDGVVSKVLNSANKPEEIVLSVSQSDIVLMTSGKREVSEDTFFPCSNSSYTKLLLLLSPSSSSLFLHHS